jgi:hypothetical protein
MVEWQAEWVRKDMGMQRDIFNSNPNPNPNTKQQPHPNT